MDVLLVAVASLLAGFVDAIVGGGGLVLLPALFAVFSSAHPATLLGVNKGSSVWGTAAAAWTYTRRVRLPGRALGVGAVLALLGSFAGAWAATVVSPEVLRRSLPAVLLAVFLYTLWRKDLGQRHAPRMAGRAEAGAFAVLGLSIGFYDGFLALEPAVFLCFCWCGGWATTSCTPVLPPNC